MKKNLLLLFTLLMVLSPLFSQTFSSIPNTTIPDNSCDASNEFPIDLTGQGLPSISAGFGVETVCIDLTHAWTSDLDISLVAPNGDAIILSTDNGGSGDNYTNTCFNMEGASGLINLGNAPFTGTYIPEGDLGSFASQDPNAIWALRACDDAAFEIGAIISWEITFASFSLPVTLTSFSVQSIDDKSNQLTWQTASELNNMGFDIERSSDGRNWEVINFVAGNGTTSATQSYSFLDQRPFPGNNYYRLKQLDHDGQFEYSEIRIVLMDMVKEHFVEVFPNPSSGRFRVSLNNPEQKKARVRLFDSIGNLIWMGDLRGDDATVYWEKEFNLPQREIYFVAAEIGDQVQVQRIAIVDDK